MNEIYMPLPFHTMMCRIRLWWYFILKEYNTYLTVSEQQQSRGCAACKSRLQDSNCHCLTDETGKSSGHIHMLIQDGLSSWLFAFGAYITWMVHLTCTHINRNIHTHTLCVKGKGQNFKLVRLLISCRVSKAVTPKLWDDKWPSTHLKWESSWRNPVIDSFFTKWLNREFLLTIRQIRQNPQPRTSAAIAVIITTSTGLYMNNMLFGL